MIRGGIPAYDAGEALAQGRPQVLRRALDRLIEPRSALVEALSDRAIDLLVAALDDVRDDFVRGVLAGADPGTGQG
jgi:hypothetical protein|tara:strand:+ start:4034 stop:4261 length:228 start_codon:yes stop_codon:yes gene_type:complete